MSAGAAVVVVRGGAADPVADGHSGSSGAGAGGGVLRPPALTHPHPPAPLLKALKEAGLGWHHLLAYAAWEAALRRGWPRSAAVRFLGLEPRRFRGLITERHQSLLRAASRGRLGLAAGLLEGYVERVAEAMEPLALAWGLRRRLLMFSDPRAAIPCAAILRDAGLSARLLWIDRLVASEAPGSREQRMAARRMAYRVQPRYWLRRLEAEMPEEGCWAVLADVECEPEMRWGRDQGGLLVGPGLSPQLVATAALVWEALHGRRN